MVQPPPLPAQGSREPSPKTQDILAGIGDPALQKDVEAVVLAALDSLAALGRIHLPQDHFEASDAAEGGADELEAGRDDKHLELAPYVLAGVSTLNRLLDVLFTAFPPPAGGAKEQDADDFDLEFDLVDGPTGESSKLSKGGVESAEKTPREQVIDTANALGGMLRSRLSSLAPRLEHALTQSDSWSLLAELDDYKHALTKSVQGLLFGILATFARDERREEILPEYRSTVSESVELRAAITDLGYHVGRFNAAIAEAQAGQLVPLVVGLSDRLGRFAARPEYRTLRAEDKRAVIDFRKQLHRMRQKKDGIPVGTLRMGVEGFSKFLEAMQAINHREVLVVHDRQRLTDCLVRLEELAELAGTDPVAAQGRLLAIVRLLASVSGRHPDLDQGLRTYTGTPVEAALVPGEVGRWRALAEAALSVVG